MDATWFTIEFYRPEAVYFPGELVLGEVKLEVDRIAEAKGLKIQLKGYARATWSYDKTRSTCKFLKDEECCHVEVWLREDHGRVCMIPGGNHTYRFALSLPSVLPSSFEGLYGHVRYTAKATLVRSKNDQTTEKSFRVNGIADLNTYPEASLAPKCNKIRPVGFFYCEALLINLRLNKGGYVPGEQVLISGTVQNRTSRTICRITVKLIQVIRYNQHGPSRTAENMLFHGVKGRIEARGNQVWTNVPIPVPLQVYPTDLGMPGCLIGVTYHLKIEAEPDNMKHRSSVHLPLIIGTVPLRVVPTAGQKRPLTSPASSQNRNSTRRKLFA